jgi:signal transduction histidine kinase
LAQTIAEAHGGTLTAGANPGGGAIFTVSLPKAR